MGREPITGEFYVTKTLLWSDPDCNRRIIHRWPGDAPVAVFNQQMGPWTTDMQKMLDATLNMLNERFQKGFSHE